MAKSRPVPRVPKTGSPTFRNGGGSYAGTRATKSPEGPRPVPKVARNTPSVPSPPGAVKRPIKHTSMPRPNKAAQRSSRGRQYGSGGNVS